MEIKGLSKENIKKISEIKGEDPFVLEYRLKSLEIFESKPEPSWGPAHHVDFSNII